MVIELIELIDIKSIKVGDSLLISGNNHYGDHKPIICEVGSVRETTIGYDFWIKNRDWIYCLRHEKLYKVTN